MRILAGIVATAVSGAIGTFSGLIVGYLIADSAASDRLREHDPYAGAIGGIVGLIVAGALASRGDKSFFEARRYSAYPLFVIVTRAGLAASGWGFLRIALDQDHGWSSALFFGMAFLAWGAAAVAIGAVLFRKTSRAIGYLMYLTGGCSVVILGACLSGTKTLRLEREGTSQQATCTITQTRWLGRAQARRQQIGGVREWKHHSAGESEGIVLLGAEGELFVRGDAATNSVAARIAGSLDRFLNSRQATLTLTEETPFLPWSAFWFLGAGLFVVCITGDPLIPDGDGPVDTTLIRAGMLAMAVSGLITASSFVSHLNHHQRALAQAKERLLEAGLEVREGDLIVRGATIYSDAWRVKFDDPEFDDDALRGIVPHLEKAPGLGLDFSGTKITDEGVELLEDCRVLDLDLRNTQVTNQTFALLKHSSILSLDIRDTAATGAGLPSLGEKVVYYLRFSDPRFGDDDLELLMEIKGLRFVEVAGSQVTREGLAKWNSAIRAEVELTP